MEFNGVRNYPAVHRGGAWWTTTLHANPDYEKIMENAITKLGFSARGYDRILKRIRTTRCAVAALPPVLPAAQHTVAAPVQTIARARRWHGPLLTPEQEADIARRYPAESQERLAAVYNVPLNHIRIA